MSATYFVWYDHDLNAHDERKCDLGAQTHHTHTHNKPDATHSHTYFEATTRVVGVVVVVTHTNNILVRCAKMLISRRTHTNCVMSCVCCVVVCVLCE